MDKEMINVRLCTPLIIFVLSNLLLTCCVFAQCGDCEDKNSTAWAPFRIGTNISTAERAESSRQINPDPSVLGDTTNTSASCDDNKPCTRDPYGANGCVHDPVNCDDGNDNTADVCGPSGCVNTPMPGESGKAYFVEVLSHVLPEIQNETTKEITTINESQSVIEELAAQPICDDGNPCNTDAYNGTSCGYALMNCDDGNDSTLDSCRDGACINEPIDSGSIISENNSTARSSSEALIASHPHSCDDHDPCSVDTLNGTRCEHKAMICDDGDPITNDYCFGGVCYNTTLNCDDGNNCTTDSFNGKVCVHRPKNCDDRNACTIDTCDNGTCVHTPKNCNDGNPCTVDYCDPVRGSLHSPVVCGQGKTCIDGVCQYLYYPYVTPYYPYVAPPSTLPPAQSYTIPAATAITLPWAKSVTALNTLKVKNGIAYSSASPLMFVISLDLEDQAVSGDQKQLSISERAEMIGLSWKDTSFTLNLIQPDGSTFPVQSDNQNVLHLVGSNYDYYFLRSAAKGNWGIEVKPINPGANGVGFSLITGLVKGAIPIGHLL